MNSATRVAALESGSIVKRIVTGLGLLTLSLLTANAYAQSAFNPQSAPNAIDRCGWWSPDRALFPAIHPSLLAMVDRDRLVIRIGSRSLASPARGVGFNGDADPLRTSTNPAGFKAWLDSLALHPAASLYSLGSRYQLWQSSLAESHPRMNVNGGSAYAFMQINIVGVPLPVGLYIPTLRGSVGDLR